MTDPRGEVDFATFRNLEFDRGASVLKEALWLVVSRLLFEWPPARLYGLKAWTLRKFGARVGAHSVIKPGAKITFPWKLTLGDHVWLGEDCWLINLAPIEIADHVCVSQGAMLCTGSHDYKLPSFDLITRPIRLEKGAWVGARAWVGPGVTIASHAVLTACSATSRGLEAYGIYQGNPAVRIREREIGARENASSTNPM